MNLHEQLSEKYIAYLDVLGFKELVGKKRLKEVELYFNTIHDTLREIGQKNSSIQSILISDSTILIGPDSKESFKVLLGVVQNIQAKLALKNIWIRGAITFGDVYFDDTLNVVVGKGLVDAFLLEQEATYPRVIIDSSIVVKIADNMDGFLGFVNPSLNNFANDKTKLIHSWQTLTESDALFVAYAHEILLDAISNRTIHLVYNRIKSNLYSEHRHYQKFLWVKNYFNEVLYDFSWRWDDLWMGSPEETANREYVKRWHEKFTQM